MSKKMITFHIDRFCQNCVARLAEVKISKARQDIAHATILISVEFSGVRSVEIDHFSMTRDSSLALIYLQGEINQYTIVFQVS